MDDLIKRLEAATGPDRELDADIFCAVNPGYSVYLAEDGTWECMKSGEYGPLVAPHYTSSIDAALTLVPDGWAWRIGYCSVSDDAWVVPDFNSPIHGQRMKEQYDEATWHEGIDIDQRPSGRVAIALCIAALKARQ